MSKKYICLSFDDGPNNVPGDATMNNMLDILEKYNVPASFFLIGNKVNDENKKVIKRAMDLGCDIQNHTWTHPDMTKLTKEQMLEEYNKCDEVIQELTGKKAEFFRPPYISVNDEMYENISVPFICGHGCEDWIPEVTAEERINQMLANMKNGTIYLLHVSEGNDATLQAVDLMIPILLEKGYKLVNLPDLFKNLKIDPKKPHALWRNILDD